MKLSKPLDLLTVDDLRVHPVWEWSLGSELEGDETYVRPTTLRGIPRIGEYHVSCEVVTAHGRVLIGLLSFRDGMPDAEAPFIADNLGSLWNVAEVPPQRDRGRFISHFGAEYNAVFPIKWKTLVPLRQTGAVVCGTFTSTRSQTEVVAACPFCGGQLRTNRARQCPKCFRSWP